MGAWVRNLADRRANRKNKIISHPLNICTGSWRQFPVIMGEESTYVLLRLRTRRLTIPTVKRTRDIWSRHSWAFLFSSAPFNSVKTYGFMDSSCKTIAPIAVRRWWRSAAGQQLRPSAEMFQPLHRKEVNVDVTPSSGRLWRLRKHFRRFWDDCRKEANQPIDVIKDENDSVIYLNRGL